MFNRFLTNDHQQEKLSEGYLGKYLKKLFKYKNLIKTVKLMFNFKVVLE